ncbi:MAG: hypothetical protein P4L31_02560 [Candidatus Babeliales bacterium]|nr:hypothetical protein [Candidatus Babeliales bacterium]
MLKKSLFHSLLTMIMLNAGALNGSSSSSSSSSSGKSEEILFRVGACAAVVGATLVSTPVLVCTAAGTTVVGLGYGYYWWKNSIIRAELLPMEKRLKRNTAESTQELRGEMVRLAQELRGEIVRSAQDVTQEIQLSEHRQMQHGAAQLQASENRQMQHVTVQSQASEHRQMQHGAAQLQALRTDLMQHIDSSSQVIITTLRAELNAPGARLVVDRQALIELLSVLAAERHALIPNNQPLIALPNTQEGDNQQACMVRPHRSQSFNRSAFICAFFGPAPEVSSLSSSSSSSASSSSSSSALSSPKSPKSPKSK